MRRMMNKKKLLTLGGVILIWLGYLLILLASESQAQVSVVLRVVDQNNVDITGSVIQVLGLNVPTGSSVELPESTYTFHLLPGILGVADDRRLYRSESAEVTAATTEIAFEWITLQGAVRLHDQHGVEIPGSSVLFRKYGHGISVPTGSTVILPITDESAYPTMGGDEKDGYLIYPVPGFFGVSYYYNHHIYRQESVEVTAATTEIAFEWITSQSTVRLHDQHGEEIPGSSVLFRGFGHGISVPTGSTVTLPITDESVYPTMVGPEKDGGYLIYPVPGFFGVSYYYNHHIYRQESVEVTAATTEIAFEWIMSQAVVRLHDQHGVEIPGSSVLFRGFGHGISVPTGSTVTLPITDESVYPTMVGPEKDGGYLIYPVPGFFGVSYYYNHHIYRQESVEVTAATTEIAFEWITFQGVVRVHDQHGEEIPGSSVLFAGFGHGISVLTGSTVTLPITDESVYPTMVGREKDGYLIYPVPGIFGIAGYYTRLYREEWVEVTAATTEIALEWLQIEGPIEVIDINELPVPDSTLVLPAPFPSFTSGDTVCFPITEDSVYPTISGSYSNGYPITVTPGDIAPTSGTFQFEVLAACAFEPGSFVIGGNTYSLMCACATNQPPIADAGGPYSVDEGDSLVITAFGSDPEEDALTFAWDLDNNGAFETPGQSVTFPAAGLDGTDSKVIVVQVTDTGGLSATDQTTVDVLNVAPIVLEITAPVAPVRVNTEISASADFTDPGILDTHTATWDWGDDNTSAGTVDESGGLGSVSGNHIYTAAGVYTIKLTVTDDDSDSGESIFQYVVVYNPDGGFVTGGGWINSPEGAYTPDPSLTGKANFGFVSKYKKGADVPTGETEFNFKVAYLNFHSELYDWLVVAGARAQYKGAGTINGGGNYGFMLTAIDEELTPSTDVDLFRIKIWNKVDDEIVYDNQMGAEDDADLNPSTTEISGGNIKIHKGESAAPVKPGNLILMVHNIPGKTELLRNFPNPFNPETWIPYQIREPAEVVIRIYDAQGRLVRTLDLGQRAADFYLGRTQAAYWNGKNEAGEKVASGIYFYQLQAGNFTATRKMVIVK